MRNHPFYLIFSALLLVSGCATNGYETGAGAPQIDRISAEELARIMPKPVATLSLEDIVRLIKEGNSTDQIIDKIKVSNSMYDLTPSQSVVLSKQGVDSKVLDYIHASRELALRNNLADEINKREKEKRAELDKLKNQLWQQQHFYDPYCRFGYYGINPYGYYGYGSRLGPRYGTGAGFWRSWGCW